jgi:hypothetical protein
LGVTVKFVDQLLVVSLRVLRINKHSDLLGRRV